MRVIGSRCLRRGVRVLSCVAVLTPGISQAEQGVLAPPEGDMRPATSAPAPRSEQPTYRLPLALAYLAPVTLVTAGAFALSSPGYYVTGIAGAASMIAAPPLVHGAYGNGSGAGTALLGTLASVGAGAVVGAGLLIASGYQPKDADDGVGRVGGAALLGGLYGAGLGYLIWGVIDVARNAESPVAAPAGGEHAATSHALMASFQPLFAEDRNSVPELAGASVGLAGEF